MRTPVKSRSNGLDPSLGRFLAFTHTRPLHMTLAPLWPFKSKYEWLHQLGICENEKLIVYEPMSHKMLIETPTASSSPALFEPLGEWARSSYVDFDQLILSRGSFHDLRPYHARDRLDPHVLPFAHLRFYHDSTVGFVVDL